MEFSVGDKVRFRDKIPAEVLNDLYLYDRFYAGELEGEWMVDSVVHNHTGYDMGPHTIVKVKRENRDMGWDVTPGMIEPLEDIKSFLQRMKEEVGV